MSQPSESTAVRVAVGPVALAGDLRVPARAAAIVLFAHGSGSGRRSPRNRHVAQQLGEAGLATLLLDLLTPSEQALDTRTGRLRFDIRLLAERLLGATAWLGQQPSTRELRLGYFGASIGAAAALVAAAVRPRNVGAIVSRGGRADLAGPALPRVVTPTLLIVGGHDVGVVTLNRQALDQLRGPRRLAVVPGATHLFEEPGALDQVSRLARDWFIDHLAARASTDVA